MGGGGSDNHLLDGGEETGGKQYRWAAPDEWAELATKREGKGEAGGRDLLTSCLKM